jgi:hypothetical protein
MRSFLLSGIVFLFGVHSANAQCGIGEVELNMNVFVDPWGEETYWEITPAGAGCGNGTIAFGSNAEEVGCGLGIGVTGNYGYPDNTMIAEGPFCLIEGESYDLYFYDSYGDGGLVFEIYQDETLTNLFYGQGSGNMMTFVAGQSNTPSYDLPCGALEVIPDGPAVAMNNQQAIANYNEIHPPGSNCSVFGQWCETGVSNSIWAYFIADENKSYEISSCNEGTAFDTQIAVWKGNDCGNLSGFQLISSNDDQFFGCGEANGYASTCYAGCLEQGGIYYIQVDGYNGESGNLSLTVTSYSGDITMEANFVNGACPVEKGQQSSGYIEPYIWGMGSDFSCVWEGSNGYYSTDHFVYNLNPGVYTLVATDNCGVEYTGEYEIFDPSPWDVSISITEASCQGAADGEILVNPGGATGPYGFAWAGPGNFTSDDNPITGLYVGEYLLIVIDANGCQYAQELNLDSSDDFTFELGADTTLCLGDELLVYGPPGMTYLWQDGSTNQFYEIITEEWGVGDHALILTGSTDDGCVHTEPFIFVVETCIGINEATELNVVLYPNPSEGSFTLLSSSQGNFLVRIADATGRIVYSSEINMGSPQLINEDLAPGVYVVNILNREHRFTLPLVVR